VQNTDTRDFAAGAAAISLEPPLGLPMVGFVRRHEPASWSVGDLEATAVVIDARGRRGVIVGVDTLAIQAPEIDVLRERIAEATGAAKAAVLVNFNHTHCAPPASPLLARMGGHMEADAQGGRALADYARTVADRVVEVARLAASRLEAARPSWGVGFCPESVNRRERLPDGRVILGWNPDGMVDWQVPALALERRDGSSIATVVGYGCHTVCVGPDVLAYCADYAGPMREAVRAWTGGECVFLQGAGGNVLPRVAFAGDLAPSRALGRRLALAALAGLANRPAWPTRYARSDDGSVTPFHLYRPEVVADGPAPAFAVAEVTVRFPLLALPTLEEISAERVRAHRRLHDARSRGAGEGELNTIRYDLLWAERTERMILDGTAPTSVAGPVHALRVGDGAIVTGPGEIFSEIGLAVRERSPADVTLYAGYTNGLISYFPAAASYPEGGYEPGFGNRTFALPAQVTPESDGLLVGAGLELLGRCFPERPLEDRGDLLASGTPPAVPAPVLPQRP
jgi:neutral ceramidase